MIADGTDFMEHLQIGVAFSSVLGSAGHGNWPNKRLISADPHTGTPLGGGALMKRKPAALRNIGIDLDGRSLSSFACDYPVERVHGDCHAGCPPSPHAHVGLGLWP